MNALIYKFSLRNGLILGAISAALTIVFYLIDPLLQYTNLWVPLLSAVVMIALVVILAQDVRRKIGGFWSFGQAYLSLLIMSVIIIIISILLGFIIMKYVDPTLPSKINDATLDVTTQRLEKFGLDQSKIDDATKQFNNGEFIAKLQPTFVNEIKGFAIALAIYAIIDLIIAACIKKKLPMFATVVDDDAVV